MSPRSLGSILCLLIVVVVGCDWGGKPRPGAESETDSRTKTLARNVPKPDAAHSERHPPPAAKPLTFRLNLHEATLDPGDLGLQLIAESCGREEAQRDLSGEVAWQAEPEGIVRVERGGYVRPLKAGDATVWANYQGERQGVAIHVVDSSRRTWDFANDIVPIFTRYGCNTGGCHGRADGQNGFHLSLFGYDPKGDYRALTRESGGRRVDCMDPESSLLIRKGTGRTPHGGGPRLPPDSDALRTLISWIADGSPECRGETHGAVVQVTVEPRHAWLPGPGPRQLRVLARFEDGHLRDVTRLATYKVNDETALEVDSNGLARLQRRAEADIIVRYQSRVLSARLSTPINPALSFDFKKPARRNFIDEVLFRRLESLKVPPSPPASDASFLRRATLDLTGQIPLPEEVKAFVADTDPAKRVKTIDELMKRQDFVWFWRLKLGDMLQISQARFGNGAGAYQAWLTDRLEENAPWDSMVRELLTSLGNPNVRGGGPVNYALDGPDAKVRAELTAQRFLGLRIRCAQCHNHPFDVWTQDDYFGLAAIFAKVGPNGASPPGMMRLEIAVDPNGVVEHPRTREPAEPRLLDGTPVKVAADADPRVVLADWMTSEQNPYFARAMANWVWAQFFGRGLADPPDDLSAANPPVHPELLDALALHFVEHKYDVRDLIRTVATSETYALSSATVVGNEHDSRLFSHHLPRPLTAHQMADAIAQATNVPNRFGNRNPRAKIKAIEIFEPSVPSTILDTFGRCSRVNGCSPVANPPLSLRQSLLLIGGDAIESKVSGLNGYLTQLMTLDPSPSEIVEYLYYRTLCRPPTSEELSHWTAELKSAGSLQEASEDLFWALLNSREFAFNH